MSRKLVVVFILAFFIRLIAVNQSLWLDEATTAKAIQLSFSQIVTQFSIFDFHPPLYYFLMKIWSSIFGLSEISLRLPSVIFALIAGWYLFKIGEFIKDKETGFWSVVVFLFNPLIVYYSQEARMYMMVTCMLVMSLYYFIGISKKNNIHRSKEVVLFNIFTGLSFATFYGSVFFISSFYLYVLLKKRYKVLLYLIPGFVISLLLLSPLLAMQLNNAHQVLGQITNWSLVLGKVTLKNLLLIPLKFATGRISFTPKILYYIIGFTWSIVLFFIAFLGARRSKLLLFLFVTPLLIGFFVSFFTPMLQYFRFLYLIPVLSVLVSLGMDNKQMRYAVTGILLLYTCSYLLMPSQHREDWKTLASQIKKKSTPVYMISAASDPLNYYGVQQIYDIRNLDMKEKEIIIVPYVTDIYGISYASQLQKFGYVKMETTTVRGLSAEIWRRLN